MRLLDRYLAHRLRDRFERISHLGLSVLLLAVMLWSAGCKKGEAPAPANQPQAQSQGQAPAQSVDDLVAPIALYPDKLLGQLLVVATNPQEVLDLGNWLIVNQSMKPADAPAAAKAAGFSTSAQYLSAFPQVVDTMCQQMDWTTQLGEAFKSNEQGVMSAIQAKRLQAQQHGNLQSSPQMTVNTASDNGKEVVQIQPADPQVVYVPQYNPETVYSEQAPAQTTTAPAQTTVNQTTIVQQPATTVVQQPEQSGVSTGGAVAIGLLSFGLGMAVGNAFHDDDYYPYPAWGHGGMYYGGHPYYPPPYRAPVYAGYRPAGGYYPPNNYRWSNYNRNVNVKVNNNYYNRYNNNRAGNNGYLGNRPSQLPANGNNRGQSGYLGANDRGRNNGPGDAMARANPALGDNRGRNEPGRNNGGLNNNNRGLDNNGRGPAGNDRGRPNNGPAVADNRANSLAGNGAGRGGDRGFSGNGNPQTRGGNQGAFGGGNANGPSARQDSGRGRQSMNAPSGGGGGGNRGGPSGGGGGARPAPQQSRGGGGGGGGGRPAPSGGGGKRR